MLVTYANSRLVICNILICDCVKNIFLVLLTEPGLVLVPLLMFLQIDMEVSRNIIIWWIFIDSLNFEEISMDFGVVSH